MAHSMTLSTKATATRPNLRRQGQAKVVAVKDVVRRSRDRLLLECQSLCPYDRTEADDFHMVEQLRGDLAEDQLSYEVGFHESDFTRAGQDFYPLWVIFGSRFMSPRDFIFGPAQAEKPRLRRELKAALVTPRRPIPRGR